MALAPALSAAHVHAHLTQRRRRGIAKAAARRRPALGSLQAVGRCAQRTDGRAAEALTLKHQSAYSGVLCRGHRAIGL